MAGGRWFVLLDHANLRACARADPPQLTTDHRLLSDSYPDFGRLDANDADARGGNDADRQQEVAGAEPFDVDRGFKRTCGADRASRGPRTWMVTSVGDNCTVRDVDPTRTATSGTAHSIGCAAMSTVTWALPGERRRIEGSATPIVTDSLTVADFPATDTGSVIAWVSRAMALAGPTTSTVAGSALTVPTT
jgi:hypothetical protein